MIFYVVIYFEKAGKKREERTRKQLQNKANGGS